MGNPHGYEAGFTIEQHRDELIDRLGLALKEIAKLKVDRDGLLEALKAVWEFGLDDSQSSAETQALYNKIDRAIRQAAAPPTE